MHKFAFVLEQTLGHVAHGRNLERALAAEPQIAPTIIRLTYSAGSQFRHVPGLGSWSFRASWTARSALRQRLRQDRLDGLFIHTQVAALLAGDLMREVPTVISVDATPKNFDTEGPAYGHRRGMEMIEAAKSRVNQNAFGRARAIVTWCHWAADSLIRDYGVPAERVHVIRPGVDLGLFQAPPHRPDGLPVRLLFVGGDFVRKGGLDLLAALPRLDGRVKADIVTGSDVGTVPANCRVHRGLSPQSEELIELYRQADIFVLPARGDCFPQAVAEALASGLPVIAFRVGAIPEMVRDGENGYLVPPASPRNLAQAIQAQVDHPVLRAVMGRNSRQLAEQEHDANRNNRFIFRLMARLAEASSRERRSA